MSLTTFINNEFRLYYEADPLSGELGNSLIGSCAQQAIRNICKYRRRENQKTSITITTNDEYIILPANFISAIASELYRIKFGVTAEHSIAICNTLGIALIYLDIYFRRQYFWYGNGSGFRADGCVYAYPTLRVNANNNNVGIEQSLQLFQNDSGRWCLYLDSPALATRTETKFTYNAMHQLTDRTTTDPTPDDSLDTISGELRDILLDETMKLALLAQARQLVREAGNDRYRILAAQEFSNQAKLYGQKMFQLTSLGAGL